MALSSKVEHISYCNDYLYFCMDSHVKEITEKLSTLSLNSEFVRAVIDRCGEHEAVRGRPRSKRSPGKGGGRGGGGGGRSRSSSVGSRVRNTGRKIISSLANRGKNKGISGGSSVSGGTKKKHKTLKKFGKYAVAGLAGKGNKDICFERENAKCYCSLWNLQARQEDEQGPPQRLRRRRLLGLRLLQGPVHVRVSGTVPSIRGVGLGNLGHGHASDRFHLRHDGVRQEGVRLRENQVMIVYLRSLNCRLYSRELQYIDRHTFTHSFYRGLSDVRTFPANRHTSLNGWGRREHFSGTSCT